jgi:hypothetical protein
LKIGIGVTVGEIVKPATTATIGMMMWHIGHRGDQAVYLSEQSAYLDENANHVFERAVIEKVDYLMMIETDVETIEDKDIIGQMLAYKQDVVSGIYYGGKYPHRPILYNFTDKLGELFMPGKLPEDKAFYMDAAGSGFMLLSRKALEAFTPAVIVKYGNPYSYYYRSSSVRNQPEIVWRQDLAFCWRLKKLGFKVLVDPTIKLGHWKDHRITKDFWDLSREHMERTGEVRAIK